MNVHSFIPPPMAITSLEDRQQHKRVQILKATRKLLAERGFHGFSIKQVAALAGVATGTVYLYFRDRQDLIEQLHMAVIEDIAAAAFTHWDPNASSARRYFSVCEQMWQYCMDHPDTLLCKGQFDQLPPAVLRTQYEEAQSLFLPLADLFTEGRRRGELIDLPDHALFSLSIDTLWQLARRHMLDIVHVDEVMLKQVIEASWRSIQNPG
ncbi:TetR/AcrR family transcriptional regulator [Teredinibacter turnerae]|uniref:TetR/AcrR family transcriptional regulator n=2 Tax=Teredinibacter turnerae TaxID=2426 RepID=UPI001E36E8E1|nr:TetR/AcrR family transcriptional regulator [Teredinibacter turnerae]